MCLLLDAVRAAERLPVFPIGGPCRCGCASGRWGDADWLIHHADSWDSAWILTGVDEVAVCAAVAGPPPADVYAREWYRAHPVCNRQQVDALMSPDPWEAPSLRPALACIAAVSAGSRPVLASVWGPLTAAATLAGADRFLRMALSEPGFVERLVDKTAQMTGAFADAALMAGADHLWIAEPLAALFSPSLFKRFGSRALTSLVDIARQQGKDTVLHVCGDTTHLTDAFGSLGIAGLSIDAAVDLADTSDRLGEDVVVIGNLWPLDLIESTETELAARARMAAETMQGRPYVLATGCSCPDGTTSERLGAFIDAGAAKPGLAAWAAPAQ